MGYDASYEEWVSVRVLEETLPDGTRRYARVTSVMQPESFARLQALLPWARRRRLTGYVFFPEEGELVPLSRASSSQFRLVRPEPGSMDMPTELPEEWVKVALRVQSIGGLPSPTPYGFSPRLRYFPAELLSVDPVDWPSVANDQVVEVIFVTGEIRRLAMPDDMVDALRKMARSKPSSAGVHLITASEAIPLAAKDVAATRIAAIYDWEREALESWRQR